MIRILFLCTGNSCRSQMAEGWLKHLRPDDFEVYSAGIEAHGLNPYAVQVMAEASIDISQQLSQTVDQLPERQFEYVITVCDHANEVCPVFPAKTKFIHHSFEDPPKLAANASNEEEALSCYRKVCEDIKQFVQEIDSALI
ncbi:arsenate reductase ArsC [Endozoicomonas sp. SM1973]|uniref:Arsenate reductase ArsC n=2 Tax=Spartinivicinus marinus TaxID=2994442 RepID=A0A853IAA4_9GAMM|nr:arsenate reductase ArsC [Spartinivicinus marinus]NYZ66781.1 arsenate reductase ArsC [Spartinivicinus marinus]